MVIIQRYDSIPNGVGGFKKEWVNHIDNYGFALDQLSGDEFVQAEKTFPRSTHVLIGEVADITEKDRVLHGERVYTIRNVDNPMGLGRHLEVLLEYMGLVSDD